jgi:Protein of unknown function (DUF5661)
VASELDKQPASPAAFSLGSFLPVLAFTTAGPSLVVAALQGERMPDWGRWLLGATGLVTMGVGLRVMLTDSDATKPDQRLLDNFVAGTKIEMEHTADPKVAAKIALDHLKEHPYYYDKLKKVGL